MSKEEGRELLLRLDMGEKSRDGELAKECLRCTGEWGGETGEPGRGEEGGRTEVDRRRKEVGEEGGVT